MLIPKRRYPKIAPSEITPEELYVNRRLFMKGSLSAAAALSTIQAQALVTPEGGSRLPEGPEWLQKAVVNAAETAFGAGEKTAPYSSATQYNNFYEFGMSKSDPFENSGKFNAHPWQVEIEGDCEVTGSFELEDLLKGIDLEERIYRLRCVEAWSMVIPWVGFPLADLIKRCKPLSSAKYVEFVTVERPKEMPGQRSVFSTIDWPYREGLRMDEAMNPLTIMAVGMYGNVLPNQNGAPMRLVVPWKYGFKHAKGIVRFTFSEKRPRSFWENIQGSEYGFWANVNPDVPHPRWSQATEKFYGPNGVMRMPTQLFNGYGEYVATLYSDFAKREPLYM